MGIPSFFTHIIKRYYEIFKKLETIKQIDNVYFDANSVIYDCVHANPQAKNQTTKDYEKEIYKKVCEKIDEYIFTLQPSKTIIIAFDGVVPYAKMHQQRTRRYKSMFIKKKENEIEARYKSQTQEGVGAKSKADTDTDTVSYIQWDTTAITPGTEFMDGLDVYVRNYYTTRQKIYTANKIILSGTDEEGEGEHKIFHYIRSNMNYHKTTTTCIYGLDADLIMLCLNHLYITNSLYLFREKPSFHTDLDEIYEDKELCFMSIYNLAIDIYNALCDGDGDTNTNTFKHKLQDFIFITFLLGNDFLPHFPALNIRTHGIQTLCETYKNTVSTQESICDEEGIHWNLFRKYVLELSKQEYGHIQNEYRQIIKQEERQIPKDASREDAQKALLYYPATHRLKEHRICPNKNGWQQRYYKVLFDIEDTRRHTREETNASINAITLNYLEGLEWVFAYYNGGCIDYSWKYNFMYPPLLCDLVKTIPCFRQSFFEEKEKVRNIDNHKNRPFHPFTLLCYVLPKEGLYLLPDILKQHMLIKYSHTYKEHSLTWAFAKYLWESHVDMPDIDIIQLEEEIIGLFGR